MRSLTFWEEAVEAKAAPLPYTKSIDGFRGIGISFVMIDHYSNDRITVGMPALMMFFVVSGYLITTLLLDEWDRTGAINQREFSERRAIRLFPAMWAYIAVSVILGLVGFFNLKNILIESVANLLYIFPLSYAWLHGSHEIRMPHLWSLTWEMWFYVGWFLVLRAYLSKPARQRARLVRNIFWFTNVVGILTVGATLATIPSAPQLFAPPPLTIFYGIALAYYRRSYLQRSSQSAVSAREQLLLKWSTPVGLGVTFLFQLFALLNWRGDFALKAICYFTSPLIIAGLVMDTSPRVARVLEWKPLMFVGRISYAMYLYHFMMFYFLQNNVIPEHRDPTRYAFWITYIFCWTTTVIAGWLSLKLVEEPAQRWYRNYRRRRSPATAS